MVYIILLKILKYRDDRFFARIKRYSNIIRDIRKIDMHMCVYNCCIKYIYTYIHTHIHIYIFTYFYIFIKEFFIGDFILDLSVEMKTIQI